VAALLLTGKNCTEACDRGESGYPQIYGET